jgi:hypothetical protein
MNTGFTWTANLLIIVGLYYVSPKRRWPFFVTAVGEAIYVAVALLSGQVDLAFICLIFFCLASRNFFKWGIEP